MDRDRRGDLVAVACAAMIGLAARLQPLESVDLLWQIRTGEVVLAQGHRVDTDLFSSTFRGARVHDHEAGFEALAALVHRHFGFGGLWWANLLIVVIACAVATHAARKMVKSPTARIVAVAAAVAIASPRSELRPELVTYASILAAHLVRRSAPPLDSVTGAARSRALARVLSPIAFAAFASFFHGLAPAVGVVPLAAGIALLFDRRRRSTVPVLVDAVVALSCLGVVELLARGTVANVVGNLGSVSHILEWYSPLRFARATGRLLPFAMIAVAVLAVIGLVRLARAGKASPSDALVVGLIALFGLRWVRIAAIVPVAALPLVIAGLASVVEELFARTRASIRAAAATVAVIAAVYVVSEGAEFGVVPGFDFSHQPVSAVRWLRERRPHAVLFHPYNLGAYLIWERYPEGGVVIDGRAATLYPKAFIDRYYETLEEPAKFDAWAESARFDTVLLMRKHKGTVALISHLVISPDWELRYRDARAVVFVRR
jgi:hypothetical protein